jgi:hypothetical protein
MQTGCFAAFQLDRKSASDAPPAAMLERLQAQPSDPAQPSGEAASLAKSGQTADTAKHVAASAQQDGSGAGAEGSAGAAPGDDRAAANGAAELQDESSLVDGQRPLGVHCFATATMRKYVQPALQSMTAVYACSSRSMSTLQVS